MVIFRRFRASSSNLQERNRMKDFDLDKDNNSVCLGEDALTETSSLTDVSTIVSEYQRCVGRRNQAAQLTAATSSLSDSLSRSKPSEEIITTAVPSLLVEKGSLKKSVRFSDVHIREYVRIVGDNPSCSSGPPIAIGWDYILGDVHRVDTFERNRGIRKKQLEMVLTRDDRERLLQEWGATLNDVLDAIRATHKTKNQRRRTVNNLGKAEKIEEVMESVARKLKRTLLIKKSTSSKVKELEQQAKVAGAAKRRNSFPPSSMAQAAAQNGNNSVSQNDWEAISEWASTIGDDDDDCDKYDGVVEIDDPSSSDGSLHELLERHENILEIPSSRQPAPFNGDFGAFSGYSYASRPTSRNFEIHATEPSYSIYEDRGGDIMSVGNHMVMPRSYASSHGNDGPSINSQRHSFPVVITESEDDEEQHFSEYYDFSYRGATPPSFHQQQSGFAMAPPPRSTSFVSSWT